MAKILIEESILHDIVDAINFLTNGDEKYEACDIADAIKMELMSKTKGVA